MAGTVPYECPDLAAMSIRPPADLGVVPQEEQRRYLAGELEESREAVAERRRIIRALVFREYLLDAYSLVSRRWR